MSRDRGSVRVAATAAVVVVSFSAGLLLSGFVAPAAPPAPPPVSPPGVPERFDQPRERSRFWIDKRAPEGSNEVPVERYLTALQAMEEMPRYSTATNMALPSRRDLPAFESAAGQEALGAWTPLGPGNFGGRTRALIVHPANPAIMYAGAAAGGVWKTTNGGGSWAPLADLLPNIAVNALALDPSNHETLYAGTGEGFFNGDAVRGAGIFKTTNGGANWTHLAATSNSNFHFVNDLVVSPKNSARVYAATGTGVFRSTDGGATWTKIFTPGAIENGCLDLALRTDKPNDILFVACGNFEKGIVSRNATAESSSTWVTVLNDPNMGRSSLALAPSNQNTIYALTASIKPGVFNNGLNAVFRSTSGGDPGSWTAQVRNNAKNKLNRLLLTNPLFANLKECNFGGSSVNLNQGWYDNVIAVDPTNPNRVFAGGIDIWRSDDGGKTWGLASFWWTAPAAPGFAHADQHLLLFHPQYDGTSNRTLFAANDGGIYRTDNALAGLAKGAKAPCASANTAFQWTELNNGYGVAQFFNGAVYPDGTRYFGGTQDNGTLRGNDGAGHDGWGQIFGGDGGFVAIDPTNPLVLYVETTGLSLRKSTDGGASFSLATNGVNPGAGFLFITPFAMDPSNPNRLWLGGSAALWRTINAAGSWTQASKPLTGTELVSAVAIAAGDGKRVVAGTTAGTILRNTAALTANANTAWPKVKPRSGRVSSVTFDPTNSNVVYATYTTFGGGAHVWRSTNGGATFAARDGAGAGKLPDIPVDTLVVDPANPNRLYIGTDLGVFSSLDGGGTWSIENTGFANVSTAWLRAHQAGAARTLFAFTHGRGAWRVALP